MCQNFVNNIKGAADILFDILLRKILSENFSVVNLEGEKYVLQINARLGFIFKAGSRLSML